MLGSIEINGGSGSGGGGGWSIKTIAPVALQSSGFALNSAQVLYINAMLCERLLIPQ